MDSLCQLMFLVRFGHASSCQMDFNIILCHNHGFCSEGGPSNHSFEAGSDQHLANEMDEIDVTENAGKLGLVVLFVRMD